MADALAQLTELTRQQMSRREPTYDEWLAKQPKRVLPFPLYMNGIRIEVDQLTDADLELLPKLQAGRFFDRRIHVYRDSTPDRAFHVDWPRKSMSDRMAITEYGRTFTEIIQRLTTEEPDRT
jgi:hypothetical protein